MELGGALRNTERFWADCPTAPSRRLVFNDISAICDSYRDSSLLLRMTVPGGKVST